MITLLRESRGLSGAKLAEAADVSQSTLSKMENGLVPLDPDRMQRIARVLEYPLGAFEWTDPIYGFGHTAFYHRKQQALPQTLLRKIQANVNLTRIRLERLMRSAVIGANYEMPVVEASTLGGPINVARVVRAMWQIPMGPIENMATTVESAGVIVLRLDFGSPKISAISMDAVGTYPPVIILNEAHPADRERFTLAHELGHLVMHSSVELPDEAEAEADAFAAEFLMPASEIKTQLRAITLERAAQLKLKWRVSMGALIRRARDLGVIDERRYRSLNVSISQKGWRKVEPVELSRDEPSVLAALIRLHLEEHGYSKEDMGQLLQLEPVELTARLHAAAPDVRVVSPGQAGHLRAVL
ncbi:MULTISPECIES: helix-turn-helix domain-containing protein [unclassified Pseudoclavibacter]|uniref:helix-turn-helix domain-containing protein n=1 Tax=unclassified Pseudoclavibacter TaxID=2615177 RepID=UPI001BAA94F8|nr:XRE family transcriptional regulator [Pseudoclavibacter sp. Marseille-Q4354]MBS3177778.1 ImmA/IrrE family metallo-endopeptidase [Pseudoclavibacter sp. Marseille-Q4354]